MRKKKGTTSKTNGGTNRAELIKALNLVKPALAGSGAMSEIYTHFAFDGSNVMAYNDYAFIKTPVNVPVQCTVIAEPFFNLMNSINGEVVDLTMDGNELSVKTKSIKSKFRTLEIREFSEPSKFPQKGKRLPANFFVALDYCLTTVAKSRTDPLIHTIAVVNDDMISTDTVRASFFPLQGADLPNMLIPLESAEAIIALRDQILNYELVQEAKWDTWLGFNLSTEGVLTGKLMVGQFGVDREVLGLENFTEEITFPEEITTIVERCKYFSAGLEKMERNIITLEIAQKKLTCSLSNPTLGDFTEVIPIDCSMNTILAMNLEYFDEVTQITRKAKINPSNQNAIVFYEDEFGYNQLIALEG